MYKLPFKQNMDINYKIDLCYKSKSDNEYVKIMLNLAFQMKSIM